MKDLTTLNKYRIEAPGAWKAMNVDVNRVDFSCNGIFEINYNGNVLRVIAGAGGGWDHVSVSLENRCPTWEEMSFIHRMFSREYEVAMQLHVPLTDHININPFVLHLWRPRSSHKKIPLPPKGYV